MNFTENNPDFELVTKSFGTIFTELTSGQKTTSIDAHFFRGFHKDDRDTYLMILLPVRGLPDFNTTKFHTSSNLRFLRLLELGYRQSAVAAFHAVNPTVDTRTIDTVPNLEI